MMTEQKDMVVNTTMIGMTRSLNKASLIALLHFVDKNKDSDFDFLARSILPFVKAEMMDRVNYHQVFQSLESEIENLVEGSSLLHPCTRNIRRTRLFVQPVDVLPAPDIQPDEPKVVEQPRVPTPPAEVETQERFTTISEVVEERNTRTPATRPRNIKHMIGRQQVLHLRRAGVKI